MSFKILTESTCNLSTERIDKLGIEIISLYFFIEGIEHKTFENGKVTDLTHFYDCIRKKAKIKTSCPSTDQYLKKMESLLSAGHDILYIGMSSNISNSYDAGMIAVKELREKYPERTILDIDTRSACLGLGLLIEKACELRDKGMTLQETATTIEQIKLKSLHYIIVDDLYCLYMGGRIPKLTYAIGHLAKIKPIITASSKGVLVNYSKVLGRNRSITELAKITANKIVDPENQTLYIAHADCMEDALSLKSKILELVKVKDVYIEIMEGTVGTHAGYKTMATFFLGKERHK